MDERGVVLVSGLMRVGPRPSPSLWIRRRRNDDGDDDWGAGAPTPPITLDLASLLTVWIPAFAGMSGRSELEGRPCPWCPGASGHPLTALDLDSGLRRNDEAGAPEWFRESRTTRGW